MPGPASLPPVSTPRRTRAWSGLLLCCGILVAGAAGAAGAAGTEGRAAGASPPAARVGGTEISEAELERRAPAEMQRLRTERYLVLRDALDQAVTDRLLALAAREAGLSVAELLQRDVWDRLPAVTDAEVEAAWELAREQQPGSREALEPDIRQALSAGSRAEAYSAYLQGLKDRHGVELLLDAPRTPVAAEGFPALGPADAPVTIVEFSDFQCPFCLRAAEPLRQVVDRFKGEVRLVYRHFPLDDIHPAARMAAEASLCAHDQGRFWELHDAFFENARELGPARIRALAAGIGLDRDAFEACLAGGRHAAQVAADVAEGEAAGVAGTPALFINGRFVGGAVPYETLAALVREELARAGAAPP